MGSPKKGKIRWEIEGVEGGIRVKRKTGERFH